MNIELAKTKTIRKVDDSQLEILCNQILTWLYACYHLVPDTFQFEVSELKVLLKNYPDFLYSDIKIAFTEGMHTEYNRPCIANYAKWLNAYSELKKSGNQYSEHDLVRMRLAADEGPSEKQKLDIAKKALETCLNHYKKTGKIIDMGNATFNWLERNGKIVLSNDQKKKFYKKAKENEQNRLSKELKSSKKELDKTKVTNILKEIEAIEKGQTDIILAEAKRLALAEYFNQL